MADVVVGATTRTPIGRAYEVFIDVRPCNAEPASRSRTQSGTFFMNSALVQDVMLTPLDQESKTARGAALLAESRRKVLEQHRRAD